jgi:hypothetical protein
MPRAVRAMGMTYLLNRTAAFDATSMEELEGRTLSDWWRDMTRFHREAMVLLSLAVLFTALELLRSGHLSYRILAWVYPLVLHSLIVYANNPYFMRRLGKAALRILGLGRIAGLPRSSG